MEEEDLTEHACVKTCCKVNPTDSEDKDKTIDMLSISECLG